MKEGAGRWAARAGLALAVLAGLGVAAAGPGTRLGLWHFRTAFMMMRWGSYLAIAAAVLAVAALTLRGSPRVALPALVVAALTFGGPFLWMRGARAVPPIHDITTDTEQPPAFVDVLPRRASATNAATYGGAEVAAQQKGAYPDIVPLQLSVPPLVAYERALQAARALGWEIVAAVPQEGRIEATDTTRWFGFKDDVVIRIRPEGQGSRLDVRSLSRVGRSDIGANAARIRRFFERIRSIS